jgi:hypothetical protein
MLQFQTNLNGKQGTRSTYFIVFPHKILIYTHYRNQVYYDYSDRFRNKFLGLILISNIKFQDTGTYYSGLTTLSKNRET